MVQKMAFSKADLGCRSQYWSRGEPHSRLEIPVTESTRLPLAAPAFSWQVSCPRANRGPNQRCGHT